ncbi:MAG: hypothetical protein R3B96_07120 [Pirellulaceae bacterium]
MSLGVMLGGIERFAVFKFQRTRVPLVVARVSLFFFAVQRGET